VDQTPSLITVEILGYGGGAEGDAEQQTSAAL